MSTGTHLDHLLVLGRLRGDGGNVDFLCNLANGPLYPFQRGTTASTVGGLHHDDGIWVCMAFSVMAYMSLLPSWFLATLFPLTSRSRDTVL